MKRSELLKKAAVTDSLVAVFTLALDGDDGARRDAQEIIARLEAAERRRLREAISAVDEMLDVDAFDRHLKRDD